MAATHVLHEPQVDRRIATSATVAIIGVAYFALAIIVLHFLRPDLDPIHIPTSAYAVGPFGWLMSTAFLSMSVGTAALVLGLAQALPRPARSRAGLVLLTVWETGVIIAMLFPIDPGGTVQSFSGAVHRATGPIAFLSVILGSFLVSLRLKHDGEWRPIYGPALLLASVLLPGFVFGAASISFGVAGLAQRVILVLLVSWMILVAARLGVTSRHASHG